MKKLFLTGLIFLFFTNISYCTDFVFNAKLPPKKIRTGHLKMGHPGPAGKEIKLNSLYMTLGGEPIIPVMGEMHFSRYPKEEWEDAILKMKANGITIIATYVFWIHHEEIEGQFDWSGNKDLRGFIKLCQKHGIWAYPRIGPWCHGEVRNGGIPDWIFTKRFLQDRTNHPAYQQYIERLYGEIAKQLSGLYYKNGGPIIGIQLENEYWRGKEGEAHILWLKQTARKYGIDVPMYTVTGWGNVSVPQDEVVPLFGGYPAEPWAPHINKIEQNVAFTFEAPLNDENIGNAQVRKEGQYVVDFTRYPYLTCEIGVGNQLSEHRRPVLNELDGLAIALAKTGSGSNLPGYYVFTGGLNPVGIFTTLEENRSETGYWNEYPDVSYDFQAAIKETGELAPSYYQVKKLHYFLREFGSRLAPMLPVVIPNKHPESQLQSAVRVKDDSGFLFGSHYYRHFQKPEAKDIRFKINLKNETLLFPSQAVNVPDSCLFIWPFNFEMDEILLKYATAQPLCRIEQKERIDWFFIQNLGIQPEFCFDNSKIESIEPNIGKVRNEKNRAILTDFKPGVANYVEIKTQSGKTQRVIVLSYEEAKQVWLFQEADQKHLFLSDANVYLNPNTLHLFGYSPGMKLLVLSEATQLEASSPLQQINPAGAFAAYEANLPANNIQIKLNPKGIFDDAKWLKTSVEKVDSHNELSHKLFFKEFSLGNPSPVKSVRMFFYSEIPCKMRINERWFNSKIATNQLNQLDLTGYVQKGENLLMLDFPFKESETQFAARIIVEYLNTNRIEIYSDQSWQTTENYTIPAPWSYIRNLKAPEIAAPRLFNEKIEHSEWTANIPSGYLDGLKNLYLHLKYAGDKAYCRLGNQLVADNWFNGTQWHLALKRFGNQIENQSLHFVFTPRLPEDKVYYEIMPEKEDLGNAELKRLEVVPEYEIKIKLK